MTYLLLGAVALSAVLITACTLIQVDVSSNDEGTTTVQPNGINVNVSKKPPASP
jgi:hypothetical protein